jgi:hypothetical protein
VKLVTLGLRVPAPRLLQEFNTRRLGLLLLAAVSVGHCY